MEESIWYSKQRLQLEESLWTFKQCLRILKDCNQDIQRIWQDDAATEINARYFRPHEADINEALISLEKLVSFLIEADTKFQIAGQAITESNQLSEEITKLITFANQDISRSHSEYGVFQEQNLAAREELPKIAELINLANSCCNGIPKG